MALGAKVVNLVGLQVVEQLDQLHGIRKVSVMQVEPRVVDQGILVEVIESVGVEGGCPANDPMDFISLFQQKLGQIGAILPGYSGNKCLFHDGIILTRKKACVKNACSLPARLSTSLT